MTLFDRSEHVNPEPVVDASFETFDPGPSRRIRRLLMVVGFAIAVSIVGLGALGLAQDTGNDASVVIPTVVPDVQVGPSVLPPSFVPDSGVVIQRPIHLDPSIWVGGHENQVIFYDPNEAFETPVESSEWWFPGYRSLWLLVVILFAMAGYEMIRPRLSEPFVVAPERWEYRRRHPD